MTHFHKGQRVVIRSRDKFEGMHGEIVSSPTNAGFFWVSLDQPCLADGVRMAAVCAHECQLEPQEKPA